MKYAVTTVLKTLIETNDFEIAKAVFNENKDKYNYVEFKEITMNEHGYYAKSIEISFWNK